MHFKPEDIMNTVNQKPSRLLPNNTIENEETKMISDDGSEIEMYSKTTQTISKDFATTISDSKKLYDYRVNSGLSRTETVQLLNVDHDLIAKKSDDKEFCFNLYKTSPKSYELLRNIFDLMSPSKLVKQFIQPGTDINGQVMYLLKTRVDRMTDKNKNCSILIGATSLKANLCYNIKKDKINGFHEIDTVQSPVPATKALVVMIRGIFSDWKQPIGYILTTEMWHQCEIGNWIDRIIKTLFDIGLNVRALITDMDVSLINYAQERLVSTDSPYFLVNNKKIYHLYDATELMKSVRDSLIKSDFYFHDHIAKCKHLHQFYMYDNMMAFPLASKLTKRHINPDNTDKNNGVYAIQLLSKTVAKGLWNHVEFKQIEEAGRGTAEFVSKINDCFDALTASKRTNDENEYKKAFSGEEFQISLFNQMIVLFQNIRVINTISGKEETSAATFIPSFIVTLKSISLLFDDLKKEGHSYLLTRNLQLDKLMCFLEKMKTDNKPKLTSQDFITKYRSMYLVYYNKFILGGRNEGEFQKCTAKFNKMEDIEMVSATPMVEKRSYGDIDISKGDYMEIDTSKKHSLMYISTYLLMKCKVVHPDCMTLSKYVSESHYKDSCEEFQRYRQYARPETLPAAVPCDRFIQYVEKMDETFVNAFATENIDVKIVETLFTKIQEISVTMPCCCFPKAYMIMLFLRIKIYFTVRYNNSQFRKSTGALKFNVPKLR